MISIVEHNGNLDNLNLHKTAFMCSRSVKPGSILKIYDWATTARDSGKCVIGGFHSTLEKDVLHFLLKGQQPIIMVLARCMKVFWDAKIQSALDSGQLLISTPFAQNVKRASEKTAIIRNKMMIELADEVVVGYMTPGGNLEKVINDCGKKVLVL